jgi:hypothetical protein
MDEEDATYYFREIDRVLNQGGRAIITAFILDDDYYNSSIERRSKGDSRYHATSQKRWIFDVPAYQSTEWFTAEWVKHAEDAIGITKKGFESMLIGLDLEILELFSGSWREQPGLYFQDVVILQKGKAQLLDESVDNGKAVGD